MSYDGCILQTQCEVSEFKGNKSFLRLKDDNWRLIPTYFSKVESMITAQILVVSTDELFSFMASPIYILCAFRNQGYNISYRKPSSQLI
jgi:hypothetical protein